MAWFVTMDSRNRNKENEAYLSPEIEIIPEEQARYEAMGKAFAQKLIDEYRASGNNPYDYSLIATNPFHPYFSPFPLPCMMEGWRWPMPDRPFRDRLKGREGKVVDIIGTSFETYAISQKVIDIIESIEPGVHQYLPYELVDKNGKIINEQRWLFNVCTRIESLDYDRSNVISQSERPYFFNDNIGKHHLVIRKSVIENRALWFEYRYRGSNGFLVSDRLWDALNAAGCSGWQPAPFALGEHNEEI